MNIIHLLVGVALLLFGRHLFWIFVAGVGFIVGALVASQFLQAASPGVVLAIALAVGLIGALLSLFLQRVMVRIAGFLAGGYLLHAVAVHAGFGSLAWVGFLVGGILGAILMRFLFEWALIALSALIGATVIVQNLPLESTVSALLFLVLIVVGLIVQSRGRSRAATQ